MNPDHLNAAVQSLMTTVGPGADMREMPTVETATEGLSPSDSILSSITQFMPPEIRGRIDGGMKASPGSPNYSDEFHAVTTAIGGLPPEQRKRALAEYEALPTEAPPSPLEGRVGKTMFEVRGDTEFMTEFKSMLEESLPPSLFMFAMNKDKVFDRERSDKAFEQVKARAYELGLEIDADRASRGLPSVAGREKIERAIELLESERSQPAKTDPLADENILLDALGAAGGAIESGVMGAVRSVGGSGENYQKVIKSVSEMGK